MAASTDVILGDVDAQHVLIRPLARRAPGLFQEPFDEAGDTAIVCQIEIVAGGFHGRLEAGLRSEDFRTFLDEIDGWTTAFEGTASLRGVDEQVSIGLAGDAGGEVRVTGHLADAPEGGNRLHFGFAIDQTLIPEIAVALRSVLSAFPPT